MGQFLDGGRAGYKTSRKLRISGRPSKMSLKPRPSKDRIRREAMLLLCVKEIKMVAAS